MSDPFLGAIVAPLLGESEYHFLQWMQAGPGCRSQPRQEAMVANRNDTGFRVSAACHSFSVPLLSDIKTTGKRLQLLEQKQELQDGSKLWQGSAQSLGFCKHNRWSSYPLPSALAGIQMEVSFLL